MPRARDSTELQHHFCQFVFFIQIYSVKIIYKHSRRMGRNYIYTLYIGNNITKFDHLSLNIRLNNRYYRFGSYILNISSNFVDFFRTNTFCKINTRNFRENGRTVELTLRQLINLYNSLYTICIHCIIVF